MKAKAIILLLLTTLTLSSCGMKRALTLPPKDGEEKKHSILS